MANFGQWVSSINRALAKLRFADSDSVTWERSVEGMRAHVRFPPTPHTALSTGGSGATAGVLPVAILVTTARASWGEFWLANAYANGYSLPGVLYAQVDAGAVSSVVVTPSSLAAWPADLPSSGYLWLTKSTGEKERVTYSSRSYSEVTERWTFTCSGSVTETYAATTSSACPIATPSATNQYLSFPTVMEYGNMQSSGTPVLAVNLYGNYWEGLVPIWL